MNDPVCKNFFDDNFVVTHLIVYESSDKKALENPGAEALLEKYQDSSKGIPFWLVYDEKGNYLADSRIRKDDDLSGEPGNNTGCPATPEEVHYLLQVLKRVTPLTNDQLAIIAKRFRENDSSQ